jgi:hypothetical protein
MPVNRQVNVNTESVDNTLAALLCIMSAGAAHIRRLGRASPLSRN